MGLLFNRERRPKDKTRTFWSFSEKKEKYLTTEITTHTEFPLFEDVNKAEEYRAELEKQGMSYDLRPMQLTEEDIKDFRKEGLVLVEL